MLFKGFYIDGWNGALYTTEVDPVGHDTDPKIYETVAANGCTMVEDNVFWGQRMKVYDSSDALEATLQ